MKLRTIAFFFCLFCLATIAPAKDYADPGGAFAIRIPDDWQSKRSPLGDGSWLSEFGPGGPGTPSIEVIVVPDEDEIEPDTLDLMGQTLIGMVLQLLRAQGPVQATNPARTTFGDRAALRSDVTYRQGDRPHRGYLLAVLGKRNALLLAVSAPQGDEAAWKKVEALVTTLAVEARRPAAGTTEAEAALGAQTPPGTPGAAGTQTVATGNAQLDAFINGIIAEEQDLMKMQRAFLSRSVADAPVGEAQARAEFSTQNAARLAARPGSKERVMAARKALDLATTVAWAAFDAKKYDEAATWFARRATLQKESYEAARAYQEALLSRRDDELAEWRAKLDPARGDAEMLKSLRAVLSVLITLQGERLQVLQTFAREGNDDAALLKYGEMELRMSRDDLQVATANADPAAQVNAKKVQVAAALEHVAEAQEIAARFSEAEKTFNEALAIRRALPADFPERALHISLSALGDLYSYMGDLPRSRDFYQQALTAVEESAPLRAQARARETSPQAKARQLVEDVGGHAAVLILLGNVLENMDRHQEAIALYDHALQLVETLPQEGTQGEVEVRTNIRLKAKVLRAAAHADAGEVEVALKELNDVNKLWRALGGNESVVASLGTAFAVYAVLYEKGELKKEEVAVAKPYAEQIRRIFAATQNLRGVAQWTGYLAMIDKEMGDIAGAASYGDEAMTLSRKLGDAGQVADAARVLALIRLKQERPDEALALVQEADAADQRVGSSLAKAATHDVRGQVLEAKQDFDGALSHYKQAVALLESVRAGAASESDFSNLKSRYEIYERLVRLLIKMNRADEAFDYLGRAKSKQLQDSLRLSNIKTPDPALQALLNRFDGLETRLRSAQAQLQTEQARPEAERDTARIENLKTVVATTQGEYRRVFEQIKAQHPNWEANLTVKPRELRETQRGIPPGVVLVQYAPLGEQLYIFVVTKDSLKIVTPPVNTDELWQRIKAVRRLIIEQGEMGQRGATGNAASGRGATLRAETPEATIGGAGGLNEHLTSLYQMLIAPIEADIAPHHTIAFIPNQSLYYLPLHALAKKQGDDLHYLIEDKEIVYLTGADVMRFVQAPDAGKMREGLVAFGNPTGADLPFALEEVKAIAAIYPATQVLSGAQVTKSAVTAPQNLSKRIVHFATHGVLNPQVPSQSYIQLAKSAVPGAEQLTVNEVWDLPLKQVDLVTLSACETALSLRNPNGGDLTTLAEAFSTAGATTIVCSLWSVADDSTKELMVEFYKQLAAGQSKAAALRAAQLKVMRDPKFGQPFYWAPFILMGDWR